MKLEIALLIIRLVQSNMDFSGLELEKVAVLIHAANFAAERHQYLRRSGYNLLPYINHLLKVVQVLIEIEKETDIDTLTAALLHDVIEDTEVTHAQLKEKYGKRVADIVWELSDDMTLPYIERKKLQVEGIKHLSVPAQKIRIADKGSNILDLLSYPVQWPGKRKRMYIDFAGQVVGQIRGKYPKLEVWFDEVMERANSQLESS